MKPLLSTTGQLDRLRHAGLFFLLALFASSSTHPLAELGAVGKVLGVLGEFVRVAVFAAALLLACRIRCPQCGLRWFLYAIRKQPLGEWFRWLNTFSVCPKCGRSAAHQQRDVHAA
jgi:hypothetical protein